MISNQEDIKAVEQAYGGDNHIGIVMLKNEVTDASYKDLCQVGTAAKIIKKTLSNIKLEEGLIELKKQNKMEEKICQ